MKKFGFGKKSAGDKNRSSENSSPAPASSNPYAQPQQAPDPYAQDTNKYAAMGQSPYQQAKSSYGLSTGPSSSQGGYAARGPPPARGSYGDDYDAPPAYGADKYGSGGGYGANRYDGTPSATSRGPDGYGGLGRIDSTSTDDNRDALFGGAKDRYAQKTSTLPPRNGQPGGGYEAGSGASGGGYGAYGADRQLTAEEEEEEDVQATKQQIRFIKQEDVSSTRNALRIAAQAEETGRATLARLGAQGERLHNTEKNLDLSANHNRIAEERARELKTLNRSMFAVHVSNPFTATSRREQREQDIIDKHRTEREERDATREAAFGSQKRLDGVFRELQPGDSGYRPPVAKASLAERAKYQFEADSEDDEMENEIDSNLDALSGATSRLNMLARVTGQEVDEQNKLIDRITQKSDKVDDQIAVNRARLDRIH
jgi:hypothetical protein